MNNDERVDNQKPSTTGQDPASYRFLLRMSKGMGYFATRSFVEVKDFLNKEITVTPSERFLAGMPRIVRDKMQKPPVSENSDAKTRASADSAARLQKIITQSHEVLAEANTVFPITLFPDTVLVDRTKVTIIKRDLFWSSDTMSFRIEDVLNAEVTVGPLFGSLTIASRVMSTTDHFRIDHFWRKDAIYLKRIIQGYVIAQHNKIDVAHLSKDELIKTLNELGHHQTT